LAYELWLAREVDQKGRVLVSPDMKANVIHSPAKAAEKKMPVRKKRPVASPDDSQVGEVLRTVYQRTVDEAIPSEMLDLLSKLD
jgi:hypothetical protein